MLQRAFLSKTVLKAEVRLTLSSSSKSTTHHPHVARPAILLIKKCLLIPIHQPKQDMPEYDKLFTMIESRNVTHEHLAVRIRFLKLMCF